MDFAGVEFMKLKQGEIDIVIFDHAEGHSPDDEDVRREIRRLAVNGDLYIFQMNDEEKKIKLYVSRSQGTQQEISTLQNEIKSRLARTYNNKRQTSKLLTFLNSYNPEAKRFYAKGSDSDATNISSSEPASPQQLSFVDGLLKKKMNKYTELIRVRTFLRNAQVLDDEFEDINKAKAEAKVRAVMMKSYIICEQVLHDKHIKIIKKARRACCEACESAGYLNPDIKFGKRIEEGLEIGYIDTGSDNVV